ncbi:MAG: hypothetical protein E1N59_472 [Puniceicoccaceae bacterium 5H]|nr:MAG: hypothetical protein E1N59_472 [Puniceicoccaceae bacterium 5H]
MEKHEHKACPRCGGDLVCKMNNIVHCDCSSVALPKPLIDYIDDHYDDCLCKRCLIVLAHDYERGALGLQRTGTDDLP